jgi:hypothetical protein
MWPSMDHVELASIVGCMDDRDDHDDNEIYYRTFTETVLELARNVFQVAHATGARGTTAKGLSAPVVLAHFS